MNLSFVPGELYLTKTREGEYIITVQGEELFRGRVEKKALVEYNKIRAEMEAKFPAHELTLEQKRKALENLIGEYKFTQVRNSMKIPKKDKLPKTRTFG
jgi:hypothetical protein